MFALRNIPDGDFEYSREYGSKGFSLVSRQGLPHFMDKDDLRQDLVLLDLRGRRCSAWSLSIDHMRHFHQLSLVKKNGKRMLRKYPRPEIIESAASSPEEIAILKDEVRQVYRAMRVLNTRERRILLLLAAGRLSKDLAVLFGVSETRIAQLRKSAIRKVRKQLGVTV
jgi:DNA-binding CsgD family transcriptional regulator